MDHRWLDRLWSHSVSRWTLTAAMVLSVLLAALAPVAAFGAQTFAASGCGILGCGDVGTTDTGFRYVYSNKVFYKIPTTGIGPGDSTSSDPTIQYEYFYQMDCPGTRPVDAAGDIG